ncbi:MAG: hypothetical protein IKL13_03205 [Clostridia bacterium]|nr:hypothetical protein [Clostridia bacterium]
MVGRKPSPLMPKRKKSSLKSRTNSRPQKAPVAEEDEEISTHPVRPSRPKKEHKPRVRRGVKPSAPQEQLSTEDKRVMRRRRQRRRMIVRIAVLAAVIALGVVVWLNWSAFSPDKVWAWVQDLVGGGIGSYPVDLSGTGARRLAQIDNYTVVLTDSHLTYLNAAGAEVSRYGCAYSEALLCTEGKYVLVAEQSGRRLQLTTRSKTVLAWESELDIRAVSLNALGQTAVLTEGPQGYAVQITVYDKEGKVLYTRSSNRTATDVALSPDGTTVSLASVEAVDGTLNTRLEVFPLSSASPEAQCVHTVADTLLYRIAYLADGTLAAVHDGGAVLMNPHSGSVTSYAPDGKYVLGFAMGGDGVALALRAYGDTAGGETVIVSSSGTVLCDVAFTGEFRHLSGFGGRYALLTDSYAQALTVNGVTDKVTVQADGRQVLYTDGTVVVMGLNRLDAFSVG